MGGLLTISEDESVIIKARSMAAGRHGTGALAESYVLISS